MAALAPNLELGRLDTSRAHRPPQQTRLPRAGLGPPAPRPDIFPVLVPRWRETISLLNSVAAATTELLASRELYQPFRVDHIALHEPAGSGGSVTINLLAANIPTATGDVQDRQRRGLIQVVSDGTVANEVFTPVGNFTPLFVGKIIRNLPTRIVLVAANSSGGALVVQAVLTLTFLTEPDPPYPNDRTA